MTDSQRAQRSETPDDDACSRLLSFGLASEQTVVERMLDRLTASDGPRWFAESQQLQPLDANEFCPAEVRHRSSSLEQLVLLRKQCLGFAGEERSELERLRASLGYLICVARGLVEHGVLLTARDPQVLAELFEDLAEALPVPYRGLFVHAVSRIPAESDPDGSLQ